MFVHFKFYTGSNYSGATSQINSISSKRVDGFLDLLILLVSVIRNVYPIPRPE